MECYDYQKPKLSASYINHKVFSEIEFMRNFYDSVSMSCFLFIPTGTHGICNYASYVYSAIEGTLDSISTLLMKARINDAYALVRKLFDDILLEIYIDVLRKEQFDVIEHFIVKDVDEWIKGKHRIPEIKRILKTLQLSNCTKDLYPYFGWNSYLKKNRELLDDSVHGNRYNLLVANCNSVSLENRAKYMDNCVIILHQLFMIHLAFIFHLNPQYLMASDYADYMEVGETPPEGCERWIANFAQEAFIKAIQPYEKLARFIKESCELDIVC